MADEYTFIDILAIAIIVANKIPIDAIISPISALPINILKGIQNGDDIGNIPANIFIPLVGFIIVKYAR